MAFFSVQRGKRMKDILKTCGVIAMAAICMGVLTGCVERRAERKIKSAAKEYIHAKYGFKPQITDFSFMHVGEYEWNSHKKNGGYVTMEYNGRTFQTYLLLNDPENSSDNYLQQDVDDRITAYFKEKLGCADVFVYTTYGAYQIRCGVPAEIVTYEDLIEKCDNIEIYVSTYGLERDRIAELDVSVFGNETEIYLVDCKSQADLSDSELVRSAITGAESDRRAELHDKFNAYYHFYHGETKETLY